MSYDKEQKQLQRHHSARVIERRVYDWNHYPSAETAIKPSNKWNKRNPFNCGNARCHLCCNPRRIAGHLTVTEMAANESFKYELKHI